MVRKAALMKRVRLLLLATCVASSAQLLAQQFAVGETVGESSSATSRRLVGTIGGAAYEYTVELDGSVTNGAVDGPIKSYSASSDPDRWVVLPKRDRMTDRTTWYLVHYQTGLMLGLTPTGAIRSVCVIGADFPGRPVAVRVGSAPANRFREDCEGPVPLALRAQLMKGGTLIVRGYEWPNDFPVDKEGSAEHFASAMKLYLYLRTK